MWVVMKTTICGDSVISEHEMKLTFHDQEEAWEWISKQEKGSGSLSYTYHLKEKSHA